MSVRIEVLADVKPLLGEGPLWDVETERLHFVDSLGRRVFRCTDQGAEMRAWMVPSEIGSMALRRNGGAVVALRDGFHGLDLETGELERWLDPEPERPTTRLNDGKVDAAGRFLCGSMDTAEAEPLGSLWSLGPDHQAAELDRGITCSNGPCFAPDGRTLYFADTFAPAIYAYDYDPESGAATNRRLFHQPDCAPGAGPDGATVDEEGGVWTALVFDGRILRLAPDGRVDREVRMPVVKITSLSFGGPGLDVLYVTSMAEPPLPRHPGDGPLRGAVFAVHGLGVRGRPEPRYAG